MRITSIFSYLASALLILASVYIAEGSNIIEDLKSFWDLPSALVILGGLSISLVNFKVSEISTAFKDALFSNPTTEFKNRFELNKMILRSVGNYIIYAAVVFFIISIIITLGVLSSTSMLSTSIALSLLVIIYSVGIKFLLFVPMQVSLERKMLQKSDK